MTLECRELAITFGGRAILSSASLSIEAGQVVGLIGSNGAGKTVLLDVICGYLRPDSGSVVFRGSILPRNQGAAERARLGIARLFQRGEMPSDVLGWELLSLAARSAAWLSPNFQTRFLVPDWLQFGRRRWWGQPTEASDGAVFVEALGLGSEDLACRVDKLSEGQRRRLAVAVVLRRRPAFVLLDEPTASLDNAGKVSIGDRISEMARSGGAGVLIVEHDLELVRRIADSVSWLYQGRCVTDTPAALLDSAAFKRSRS